MFVLVVWDSDLDIVVAAVVSHIEQVVVVLSQSFPGIRSLLQDLRNLVIQVLILHGYGPEVLKTSV